MGHPHIITVLPLAYRTHVADEVIGGLQAQTIPTEIRLLAQTPEAEDYCRSSGLPWLKGETGYPGDRYSYAAMSDERPDFWAFCDDDGVFAADYLEQTLAGMKHDVVGWWAFRLKRHKDGSPKSYHSRIKAKPGERVDSLGSCGVVMSRELMRACGKCPMPVGECCDDMWMSGRVQSLGGSLGRTTGVVRMLEEVNADEHALWRKMLNKDEMAKLWLMPFVQRDMIPG